MTALEVFTNFMNTLTKGTTYQQWCKAHATECKNFKTYASKILMGQTPAPPTMTTDFGKALVIVGQLAMMQAGVGAKAGFGISDFGDGTFGEQP